MMVENRLRWFIALKAGRKGHEAGRRKKWQTPGPPLEKRS